MKMGKIVDVIGHHHLLQLCKHENGQDLNIKKRLRIWEPIDILNLEPILYRLYNSDLYNRDFTI
jgi:hypothetical protein